MKISNIGWKFQDPKLDADTSYSSQSNCRNTITWNVACISLTGSVSGTLSLVVWMCWYLKQCLSWLQGISRRSLCILAHSMVCKYILYECVMLLSPFMPVGHSSPEIQIYKVPLWDCFRSLLSDHSFIGSVIMRQWQHCTMCSPWKTMSFQQFSIFCDAFL